MAKPTTLEELFRVTNDMQFDNRLIEKKVEHGFLTRNERDAFLKSLPEEAEFTVVTPEQLLGEDYAASSIPKV